MCGPSRSLDENPRSFGKGNLTQRTSAQRKREIVILSSSFLFLFFFSKSARQLLQMVQFSPENAPRRQAYVNRNVNFENAALCGINTTLLQIMESTLLGRSRAWVSSLVS